MVPLASGPQPRPVPELNCAQIQGILHDYHDRELPPEFSAGVEKHLAACSQCARESTVIVGLKRILDHYQGEQPSPDFSARVVKRAREARKRELTRRLLGALAVLMLAIGGAWAYARLKGKRTEAAEFYRRLDFPRAKEVWEGLRPAEAEGAARVVRLEGEGVVRLGESAPVSLAEGLEVAPGSEVRLKRGGRAKLAGSGFEVELVRTGRPATEFFWGPLRLERGALVVRVPPGGKESVKLAAGRLEIAVLPVEKEAGAVYLLRRERPAPGGPLFHVVVGHLSGHVLVKVSSGGTFEVLELFARSAVEFEPEGKVWRHGQDVAAFAAASDPGAESLPQE